MSETQMNPTAVDETPAATTKSRGPTLLHLAIVVGILGAGVVVTALTSDVTKTSEPGIQVVDDKPFLSEKMGTWTGGALEGLSEMERKVLPKDTEGARRLYTDPDGNQVFCSIVLAGRDVTSIHRPELCLPGQGWKYHEWVENIPVPTAPGGQLQVMRMNSNREVHTEDGRVGQAHAVFIYWFVGKDRVTPHHWQRILWTSKDRVLHNTNHRWAYFLIHTPAKIDPDRPDIPQAQNEAMRVLARFVQDLYPTLTSNPS